MSDVVVVGSANLDYVVPVERHPQPGETLLTGALQRHPGGKGANQAVGAARAGGVPTTFLGCLGDDEAGRILRRSLADAGVDTDHIADHPDASGVALIWVTPQGDNTILVAPGSNSHVEIDEAGRRVLANATVVLAQLEIPLRSVIDAGRACGEETVFILNAAPSRTLPDELAEVVDILVVNEHEAADIVGREAGHEALAAMLAERFPFVIVTLGGEGSLLATNQGVARIDAVPVEVVDTTGAGDTFCGALAGALARGESLNDAMRFAAAAGALATTRPGAQESVPTRTEVEQLLQNAR